MLKEKIILSDLCKKFDNALLKRNYCQDSLFRFRKVMKEFQAFTKSDLFSPEISAKFLTQKFTEMGGFVNKGHHSKNQMYYIRTIRSLENYYLFGSFYREKNIKINWPIQFREPIEKYLDQLYIKESSDKYVSQSIFNIRCFILYLNKFDINSFSDVAQNHISGFINSQIGYAPKTLAFRISILRGFLKYAYLNNFINLPLADALPKVHAAARTTVPTVWSQDEINKIKSVIDIGNPTGKRDYAIILLVARTGLRTGDVRDLKLSDIDWNKNEITVTQGKTKDLLYLPLMDDVGWAIIDYLKNGRPITKFENVFVSHLAPFKPIIGTSTFYRIITDYISKAKLPVAHKNRIGMHSLRHSLASELLQNNVEINIIADILGHSDPETTKHYLSVNLKALRQCPLKIFGEDYE